MTTFAVDEVVPAPEPAPTIALRGLVGEHVWLGGDPELRVLEEQRIHPLLGAVHHAFADHRPLVLSPDAIWLTIAQGAAQHVRLHAEALRPRLVRHAGKRMLEIRCEPGPDRAVDWAAIISEFRALLGRTIGDGRARLLTCDFSTTTDVERVASEIVLLDAMSAYFEYCMTFVCGIPRITLTGTPADWRAIRARIDVLAELDLAWWCASLAPIADRLVAAAEGRPNVEFFRHIYKPRKAYGPDLVTGWIARLYPYLRSAQGDYSTRNPLLKLPIDHVPVGDGHLAVGIRTHDAPASPSRAILRVTMLDRQSRLFTLEGGLLAIEQDGEGRLVPRAGYLVRDGGGVGALIARLLERGASAAKPDADDAWDHEACRHDAELHALFAAIDSVQLGGWRLVPANQRARIQLAETKHGTLDATRIIDLDDRTCLAVTWTGSVVRLDTASLVKLPAPRIPGEGARALVTRQRLDRIPVVAASLIELLWHAVSGDQTLAPHAMLVDAVPELLDGYTHAAPLVERLAREHEVELGGQLFGQIFTLAMQVGDATWRTFTSPPEWWPSLARVQVGDEVLAVLIDLGDGRVLARVAGPAGPVVVLEVAAVTVTRVDPRKLALLVSTQAPGDIPIVGRSLVDVLTYALDHGRLPEATRTLADPR